MPDFVSTLRAPVYASAPGTALQGQQYFDSTTGTLYFFNGSTWRSTDANSAVGGVVSSVFGRTGAVVAASNDYTFAQIGSKPTTLSGYGITDAQPLNTNLTTWASVTPAANVGAFLAAPSSANLAAAITDETGTGLLVLNTTPNFVTGFTIGGAAASGKVLMGNGTNFVVSGPIFPTTVGAGNTLIMSNGLTGFQNTPVAFPTGASPTARKFIVSDGTNWVASTETQDPPGTAGNIMVSDGTNWKSKPDILTNASVSAQASQFATDNYLVGSMIQIPVGAWTVGTTYRCIFDMSKTAAGVVAWQVNVRIGTAGTLSDVAVLNYLSPVAQTAAVDQGRFEVLLTIRTIGTAATIICVVNLIRFVATAAGLLASATPNFPGTGQATTTFNSTTATKIGVSFNGGTSFSGTVQLVQATLNIA